MELSERYKKLCYHRRTARRAMSVKILSTGRISCATNRSNGLRGLHLTDMSQTRLSAVLAAMRPPARSTLATGRLSAVLAAMRPLVRSTVATPRLSAVLAKHINNRQKTYFT